MEDKLDCIKIKNLSSMEDKMKGSENNLAGWVMRKYLQRHIW